MPELPEVEQVRQSLVPHLRGRKILSAAVYRPRMILHPSVEAFERLVPGHVFQDVERKGKYLTLVLDRGDKILAHLRMTGALLVKQDGEPEPPFARMRFALSGGTTLWFTDIRIFGTMAYIGICVPQGHVAVGAHFFQLGVNTHDSAGGVFFRLPEIALRHGIVRRRIKGNAAAGHDAEHQQYNSSFHGIRMLR